MESEITTGQLTTEHNDNTNTVIMATLLDEGIRITVNEMERELTHSANEYSLYSQRCINKTQDCCMEGNTFLK